MGETNFPSVAHVGYDMEWAIFKNKNTMDKKIPKFRIFAYFKDIYSVIFGRLILIHFYPLNLVDCDNGLRQYSSWFPLNVLVMAFESLYNKVKLEQDVVLADLMRPLIMLQPI
jgi:hypothetical protein